uniref:Uncharacterized protein n=1 Tax=Amphimedon queenslandica TaxID=400682 RepID=A0A1X7SZ84_AMPQE
MSNVVFTCINKVKFVILYKFKLTCI